MILRRLGGGDEAYMIYAIMAQITGKGKSVFYCAPFWWHSLILIR